MKTKFSTKNKIFPSIAAGVILLLGLFLIPALQNSAPQVNAQSAFNSYLTIDGVQGSSGHAGSIDVLSWSWGATQAGNIGSQSSGAGAGKVSMSSFNIMKRIDKSSPQLYDLAQSGRRAKSVVLNVETGGSSYIKIEMANVMISSYGISSGGDMPTESVSFNFSKVTFSYDVIAAKK